MQPRRNELSAPGGTPSRKRACRLALPDLAASTLLSASVPLSSWMPPGVCAARYVLLAVAPARSGFSHLVAQLHVC